MLEKRNDKPPWTQHFNNQTLLIIIILSRFRYMTGSHNIHALLHRNKHWGRYAQSNCTAITGMLPSRGNHENRSNRRTGVSYQAQTKLYRNQGNPLTETEM